MVHSLTVQRWVRDMSTVPARARADQESGKQLKDGHMRLSLSPTGLDILSCE